MKMPLFAEQWAFRLLEDAIADPDDELSELISSMKENNQQLLDLVQQLLLTQDISDRKAVPVVETIHGVLSQVRPLANRKGTRLLAQVQPNVDQIMINPRYFRRILSNLIGNAVQHTPPGSIVSVRVRRYASNVVIRIRDNGDGFPDLAEVSGSGLKITRSLVERCEGTVRFENGRPKGACIVISLPCNPSEK